MPSDDATTRSARGAPQTLKPGDVIAGKYLIEGVIGQGAMAVVLLATNLRLDEAVALKILRPEIAKDPDMCMRFEREARSAAKLRSEHAARVHDVEVLEDGQLLIVMEYLKGRPLNQVISESGPLPVERVAEFSIQLCEGLGEAHARGIVHRDVKPENIFVVEKDGWSSVKILDFGISKVLAEHNSVTRTQSLLGSPCYMSPEQLRASQSVDPRSDIWSLGAVIFEMLTGKTPFDHESRSLAQLMTAILEDQPRTIAEFRTGVPPEVTAVVSMCLEKDRSQRYQSTVDVALALLRFAPKRSRAVAERAVRTSATSGASSRGSQSSFPEEPATPDPVGETMPAPDNSLVPTKSRSNGGATGTRSTGATSSSASSAQSEKAGGSSMRVALAVVLAGAVLAGGFAFSRGFMKPEAPNGTVVPPSSPASQLPQASNDKADTRVELAVDCSTPGSTLLLRGESHPLPFSREIEAGNHRELLEVTAAGHRGKRFWVLLDRSRSYDIALQSGSGVSEGSEAEAPERPSKTPIWRRPRATAVDGAAVAKERVTTTATAAAPPQPTSAVAPPPTPAAPPVAVQTEPAPPAAPRQKRRSLRERSSRVRFVRPSVRTRPKFAIAMLKLACSRPMSRVVLPCAQVWLRTVRLRVQKLRRRRRRTLVWKIALFVNSELGTSRSLREKLVAVFRIRSSLND
jgi:eukaryotic-like serine/threonine-protein kinase